MRILFILLTALISTEASAYSCYNNDWLAACIVNVPIQIVTRAGDINDINDRMGRQAINVAAVMNAGMYKEDMSPMGLLVVNGKQLAPLNTKQGHTNFYAQPNGVFYTDSSGGHIMTTAEYKAAQPRPDIATQSGPMLLLDGEVLKSDVVSPTAQSQHQRNAVCTYSNGQVAFVITNRPMTMHAFAASIQRYLACDSALYLDGVVSAMYAPRAKRYDSGVKDALFLVATQ